MEPEVISMFVQMVDSGATLAFEAVRRKKSKDHLRLFEAMRGLDAKALSESVSPLELASFMTGGVTAQNVRDLMSRADFKSLTRELFLACLTEARDSKPVNTARASLVLLIETVLSEQAASKDVTAFATALSDRLIDLSVAAADSLNEADPGFLTQLQQTALLKRLTSTVDVIAAHHEALVRFASASMAEERSKFLAAYRTACVERHGYITPPDFETNRKIPMEQLYVAPSLREPRARQFDEPLTIEDFIEVFDRTVVLGDPGGGKSTLSAFIASTLARQEDGPLPLHVTLRQFAAHSEELSLLEFIEREMKPRYQVAPVEGLLEDLLLTGKAVVVFDGLDELIDATKRREVTKSVEIFGAQYPHARIIVTSRRVGYEQARLDPAIFSTYLIDGFASSEVERYVSMWFHSQSEYTEQEAKEQAHAFVQQSEAVPDLRRNPLMLALMCIIFRGENYIPRHRPAVYEKCATLLFEKWDGHRGIEVPLQARDHVDAAMKYIAYQFITSNSGDTGVVEKRVVSMLAEYLHPRAVESVESAQHAAKEFVDYCAGRAWVFTEAGATADGEPIFTFAHRTFMEYFAAVHLTRVSDTPEALAATLLPKVAREEWDVVAQLAVQQVDGTTDQGTARVLTSMLDEKRRRSISNRGNVLSFIARCMSFAVISPSLVRRISSACVEHALLEDPLPPSRTRPSVLAPLSTLRTSTVGMEAEYAAKQAEAELSAALADPDKASRVIWIAMHWLSGDQMNDLRGTPTEAAWLAATVSFAESHRDLLARATRSGTFLPQVLAWHGVISIEESRRLIEEGEPDFCLRYFADPELSDGPYIGPALGEILFFAMDTRRDNLTESQALLLESLAYGIVKDFTTMKRRLPSTPMGRKQIARRTLFLLVPSSIELTRSYVDALLIVSFATIEIYLLSESRRHRIRSREMFIQHWRDESGDPLETTRSLASKEMAQFADDWLNRKVTVFENAVENEPAPSKRGKVREPRRA